MAIDPDKITSDITLELDEEEITVSDFTRALESFFGLVREVSKEAVPRGDAGAWLVKIYPGSAGIGVSPRPGAFAISDVKKISGMIAAGVQDVERGHRPAYFSDKAVEHSRTLGSLFKSKKAPANVRIWADRDVIVPIRREVAIKASEMLDAAYESEGTVEGKLEKLNSHGHLEFVIYDTIEDRAVKCEVDEKLAEKAWKNWRKRVEVSGTVRYRRDGVAVSVKANDIFPFPSDDEIPSVGEMRRLLAGG